MKLFLGIGLSLIISVVFFEYLYRPIHREFRICRVELPTGIDNYVYYMKGKNRLGNFVAYEPSWNSMDSVQKFIEHFYPTIDIETQHVRYF